MYATQNTENVKLFLIRNLDRTYHTDKTEVSSSGFGRSPESMVRNSNDHHSRLYHQHEKTDMHWSKKTNVKTNSFSELKKK